MGALVRIVWFACQFRLLVRPEGRAWLMLRRGPLDSGVWLFPGFATSLKRGCEESPRWLPVALIDYEVNEVLVHYQLISRSFEWMGRVYPFPLTGFVNVF